MHPNTQESRQVSIYTSCFLNLCISFISHHSEIEQLSFQIFYKAAQIKLYCSTVWYCHVWTGQNGTKLKFTTEGRHKKLEGKYKTKQ